MLFRSCFWKGGEGPALAFPCSYLLKRPGEHEVFHCGAEAALRPCSSWDPVPGELQPSCTGTWKLVFPLKIHAIPCPRNQHPCPGSPVSVITLSLLSFSGAGIYNQFQAKLLLFGSSQGKCSDILPVASTFLILVSWGLGFHVEISAPTRLLVN